ncbi:MAG: class IV adenylate cyclase [Anaerolineae bacterium]|nr:class IV adenylate cyclase [Anaerolineae bacterium]
MARNVEIKARVHDPERLRQRAEALSDTPPEVLHQEDTFFPTPQGRFKLRVLGPDLGQLVYYERQDVQGPKVSNYLVAMTDDPATLKTVLSAALGVRGVVRKRRTLCMVGRTRIHLDEVEGLGAFMELEVVLEPNQTPQEGEAEAHRLMAELGVEQADLIEGAYIDLM